MELWFLYVWKNSSKYIFPSEHKGARRDFRSYDKPWKTNAKKPKKSKSDLAVSSISPPSPESKSCKEVLNIVCDFYTIKCSGWLLYWYFDFHASVGGGV